MALVKSGSVRIGGLRELEKALEQLPQATGKNVLRRVLRKRAQPIADAMEAQAPRDPDGGGQLKASIGVSTKLSKRQRGLHRKVFKSDKASVEVFVGAGPIPSAHTQEFGTINHGPQPFARPAWDSGKGPLLAGLKGDLWAEVDKAAKRLARKQARLAAKGG